MVSDEMIEDKEIVLYQPRQEAGKQVICNNQVCMCNNNVIYTNNIQRPLHFSFQHMRCSCDASQPIVMGEGITNYDEFFDYIIDSDQPAGNEGNHHTIGDGGNITSDNKSNTCYSNRGEIRRMSGRRRRSIRWSQRGAHN